MADDLASFFAKKTTKKDKKKKSGVISIEDVGNRLERKAKRNELDEFEDDQNFELVKLTKNRIEPMRLDNNSEDSEWIDFNDKPATFAALNIKELSEPEEEDDDYGKTTKEPTKGWSDRTTIVEKEEVAKENKAIPAAKAYKPPSSHQRAAKAVDLNSDLAFPTLSSAPMIEKELKKMEEKQKILDLEQRRRDEEIEKRKEEKIARMMRNGQAAGRQPYGGRSSEQKPEEKQENEGVDDWRSMQKAATPKHESVAPTSPQRSAWRDTAPKQPSNIAPNKTEDATSTTQDSWRRPSTKPTELQQAPPVREVQSRPKGVYVPPSARQKNP